MYAYFNYENYFDGDTYVVRTKYEVWGHHHIFILNASFMSLNPTVGYPLGRFHKID